MNKFEFHLLTAFYNYHKNEYIYEQDIHSIEFIDDVIV